jgi:hypothetical protein
MTQSTAIEKVKAVLYLYHDSCERFDDAQVSELLHPEARLFNVGNANQFFIRSRQEFVEGAVIAPREHQVEVKFDVEIQRVDVYDDLIATAQVLNHITYSDSEGEHHSYINLAKIDGAWCIVNVLDRGKLLVEE